MGLITLKEVYEKLKDNHDYYVGSLTITQKQDENDHTWIDIRYHAESKSHKESVLGE